MVPTHHQYQRRHLNEHVYQSAHNFQQLPMYQPSFLHQHKHQCLHSLASTPHSLQETNRNEPLHAALHAHPMMHNLFSITFYRKIQTVVTKMFAFAECRNTAVSPVSPIR